MRKSQETKQNVDRQLKPEAELLDDNKVRSTDSGENKMMSGIDFQAEVLSRDNLNRAFKQVQKNHGAAGIDGMTVEDLKPYLKEHKLELLVSLVDGSYKPLPVKRVEIPKPNGGMRKLGIPTVIDRLVQQAVAQVLGPIFEEVFSDNSYGFRPNRSPQLAIQRVVELYNEGYHYVVDLDLKAYFDTVNHDMLIKYLSAYVDDPWLLRLIRRFLTSGALNGKVLERSEEGTPQGGPISPLLGNIYLNELDKELTQRGHAFVRYADDCNILVKSPRAGERVLKSITKFIEKDLKLTINQEKTKVVPCARMKFLSYTIGVDKNGACIRIARQAKEKIKRELKRITNRNRGICLDRMLYEIRKKMPGWIQYFKACQMKSFIRQLDEWVRSRIRQFIWTQWKKIITKVRSLKRLGASSERAEGGARTHKRSWRVAHTDILTTTLTNRYLERLGLINLSATYGRLHNA